jgi:hypothetical protein
MYRFIHCGRFRGIERTIIDMWENLTQPNCASWKYFENSILLLKEEDHGLRTPKVRIDGMTFFPSSTSTSMEARCIETPLASMHVTWECL